MLQWDAVSFDSELLLNYYHIHCNLTSVSAISWLIWDLFISFDDEVPAKILLCRPQHLINLHSGSVCLDVCISTIAYPTMCVTYDMQFPKFNLQVLVFLFSIRQFDHFDVRIAPYFLLVASFIFLLLQCDGPGV